MEKEYVHRCLKERLPIYLNNTASSLILKRILSQLNNDPFYTNTFDFSEETASEKNKIGCFIDNYLNPSLKYLNDPFLISDMEVAVKRVAKAIFNDESVCIYGDYDVDGITATSFLVSFLRELKSIIKPDQVGGGDYSIFYKLPDRIKDGYGLGIEPINEICAAINETGKKPLSLMITVDLGITGVKEVLHAKSKNIDVIICDHHEVPLSGENEILPDALAILNPKRRSDKFPFKFLPGVGIAFNLGIALRKYLVKEGLMASYPNLKDYLDIVCLGIVADIVPMYGDNRTLTRYGLQILNGSPRPGIKQLRRICGLHFDNVNESDIAWKIAPKINAAGRVGNPAVAVELLTQKDPKNAFNLAQELESFNKKRQMLEDACFNDSMNLMEEKTCEKEMLPIAILKGESWHPGVIGIVSSKLADYLQKPVLLLTGYKEQVYIGSARSCGNIDIYAYLKKYESFFAKFGGHKMACGLTIKKGAETDSFIAAVLSDEAKQNAIAAASLSETSSAVMEMPETGENGIKKNSGVPAYVSEPDYDEEININSLGNKELSEIIKLISPCGPLNEQPKFLIRNITLLDINRREFKNKKPKKNSLSNCYFTLNIAESAISEQAAAGHDDTCGNSVNGAGACEAKHKAMLFNRRGRIEHIMKLDCHDTGKIDVDGIIFEFFNGYIKILNFI
jgi:single-stranded-DNA-specific exonuclease